jgi:hypothetical protein
MYGKPLTPSSYLTYGKYVARHNAHGRSGVLRDKARYNAQADAPRGTGRFTRAPK